jgi:membrane-associated phospholipid phosphatase
VFCDTWKLVKSPVDWRGRDWLVFSGCIAAGGILATRDATIREFALEHRDPAMVNISRYGFEPWGSGLYSAPLIGGMFLYAQFMHKERLSATALTAGKAACITSALVTVIKQISHRHRPFQDSVADPGQWDGPFSNLKYTSFPSGHSALIFSLASVIASEYKDQPWVTIVAYSIASGTALSRIYDDRHWASDVLAGSLLGYFTGRLLWKLNSSVYLTPRVSKGGITFSLSIPLNHNTK